MAGLLLAVGFYLFVMTLIEAGFLPSLAERKARRLAKKEARRQAKEAK